MYMGILKQISSANKYIVKFWELYALTDIKNVAIFKDKFLNGFNGVLK